MDESRKRNKTREKEDKLTQIKVTENIDLMTFLLKQMPGENRKKIKSLLAHRQISVENEIVTQFNYPLEPGQQVIINRNKTLQVQELKILFEDPYIIVIEKQQGLLSIATAKEKELTAYSILSEHVKKKNPNKRIFIVHRLDRETSGVMMFAKDKNVQKLLQDEWKKVVFERIYTAVTEGSVIKEEGTIISWLKESKSLTVYSSPTPNDGQKAITHYKVNKKNNNYSLLDIKLETGRKNQIRVHMQDIGHSIIGDKKYGATKNPINRLGLHARVLSFKHPVTGEIMSFETNIPNDFLRLFN